MDVVLLLSVVLLTFDAVFDAFDAVVVVVTVALLTLFDAVFDAVPSLFYFVQLL